MKHIINHSLGQELARKTISAAWNEYQWRFSKYNPILNWNSENLAAVGFNAKGLRFNGTFEIKSDRIEVELDVPLIMRPFKGLALGAVEREVERWISKAKTGQI
jgi:hypothetical protein